MSGDSGDTGVANRADMATCTARDLIAAKPSQRKRIKGTRELTWARQWERPKASLRDLIKLEEMLPKHFGGLTTLPGSTGYGLRKPNRPDQDPEMNFNTYFVVYASPIAKAQEYFQALQRELQMALNEGLILIERQDVLLV